MSENYHKRIQKKWDKRYGFDFVPSAYRTPYGIVAHPDIVKQLKEKYETP